MTELPAYLTEDDVRNAANACQTPDDVYMVLRKLIDVYSRALTKDMALLEQQAARIAELETTALEREKLHLTAYMNIVAERTNEIAELEAIKASIAAKAQLEATQPTDAHIDALIMSIATYTASVPAMPERDVAMAAMREIVRGWMNE